MKSGPDNVPEIQVSGGGFCVKPPEHNVTLPLVAVGLLHAWGVAPGPPSYRSGFLWDCGK